MILNSAQKTRGEGDGLYMVRLGKTLLVILVSAFIFGLLLIPSYAATTFPDIQGHWAQREIENLASQGIVAGYPDGTFQPERPVTRAEFATLMIKAMKLTLFNPTAPSFSDVPRGMWCYQYVETAAAYKIVVGWEGCFYPNYGITHEQAAKMLVNALGKSQEAAQFANTATSFTDDAKISTWARGSVVEATRLGLILPYADGSFKPQAVTTRAEMAVFLSRFLSIYSPAPIQSTGPVLSWAQYDSREKLLTLTFDRTIAMSAVDVTKIGIQFNDQPTAYMLDSRSKVCNSSSSNVIQIKVVGLPEPVSVQRANIILYPGAVSDLNGVTNGQMFQFLQYIWYTDTTRPELNWVTYDSYVHELMLKFSEPVLKSSIDLRKFLFYRLDSDGDVWIVLEDLDGGRLVSPSGDYSNTVVIELTSSDASTLEYYLARTAVYLACSGIKDCNGNEMLPLDPRGKEGVLISEWESISGTLMLKSGSYDEDSNRLILNFNRTVDRKSIRLDRIALRFNSTSNIFRYLDEDDCEVLNTSDSSRIIIVVDEDRINEPRDVEKAWVKLLSNAVRDISGKGNDEVIMSLDVGESDNLPYLGEDGAIYDPKNNILCLSFEKSIKTIDISEVKLWTKKSSGEVKWVIPLDRCISWDYNRSRDQLHFHLSDDDAYWIEHERQVWVRLEAGAVLDYDGNRNEQQDVELKFMENTNSPVEISRAVITKYSDVLEWGSGDYITATFSEPIQVSGLSISDFRLIDKNGNAYSFGSRTSVSKTSSNALTIYLGNTCQITSDKLYRGLTLIYSGDSIYDLTGQKLAICSCQLEGYDKSGPEISSIKLKDCNSNSRIDKDDEVILNFEEPVWITGKGAEAVKIYDDEGNCVKAAFVDIDDGGDGCYTIRVKVTSDGSSLSLHNWWSNKIEIRFSQNDEDMVIIDIYGNPTPKRQKLSFWL